MESINWDAVSAISEALGLIVVVSSVLFVGFQIRQNATATRAATMNHIMDGWSESYARLSENENLAELTWTGAKDPDAVTGVNRWRFSLYLTGVFYGWHNSYYQWRIGAYGSDAWSSQTSAMSNLLSLPGVLATWHERKGALPEDFQMYVETEILSKPPDPNYKLSGT